MATNYLHLPNGVRVSTTPDPKGYYRIRWTDPRTDLPKDARRQSMQDARALAEDLSAGHGHVTRTLDKGLTPVGEVLEEWLDVDSRGKSLAPETLRNYRAVADDALNLWQARTPIKHIDGHHCTGLYRQLLNDLSPTTAANRFRIIKGALNYAVRFGYLTSNPAEVVEVSSGRDTVAAPGQSVDYIDAKDVPSTEDIEAMVARFDAHRPEWSLAIYLGAYSGVRVGEMLGLRVSDIGQDHDSAWTLNVSRQYTKRGLTPPKGGPAKARQTMILPDAVPGLRERVEAQMQQAIKVGGGWDAPLIFHPSSPGHLSHTTFSSQFRGEADALKWPLFVDSNGRHRLRWGFHYLRHHFCTWALNDLKLDAADVAALAGHASVKMTLDTYVGRRAHAQDRAAIAAAAWASRTAPSVALKAVR